MKEVDFSIEINGLMSLRKASAAEHSGPCEPTEIAPYLLSTAYSTHLDGEGRKGEEGGMEGGGVVVCGMKPSGFTSPDNLGCVTLSDPHVTLRSRFARPPAPL